LQEFLTAGAEAKTLEAEPQMRTYLNWLATDGAGIEAHQVEVAPDDVDVILEPPVPIAPPAQPKPPARPAAAPALPSPQPASRPDMTMPFAPAQPILSRPAPAAPVAPPQAPKLAAPAPRPAVSPLAGMPPPPKPASPPAKPAPPPIERTLLESPGQLLPAAAGEEEEGAEEDFAFSRRDMTMLGLGVGGVAVILGFVGLYLFLTRNRGKDKQPDDSAKP
jgi:hypothetical protein